MSDYTKYSYAKMIFGFELNSNDYEIVKKTERKSYQAPFEAWASCKQAHFYNNCVGIELATSSCGVQYARKMRKEEKENIQKIAEQASQISGTKYEPKFFVLMEEHYEINTRW